MAHAITARLRRYRDIARLLWRHRPGELKDPARATDEKAQSLAEDLERLGPTFVKLGQVLSTRPDLMPEPHLKALAHLQDHVEPFASAELKRIVEAELSVRISKAFSCFEERPLAAASLGQVHKAALRDGRPVVVKVQRPGIRARVLQDFDAFEGIAALLDRHTLTGRRYEFSLMLDEFKASLLRELDYEIEARNLQWLHDTLRDFPHIVVPRPIRDFTTSRVLTMEYIAGTKITALSGAALTEVDGNMLSDEVFRAYLKQILVDGMFHADPHPGNVLLTPEGKIALIDLGMVAYLSPVWRDGLFRLLLSVAEGRADEVADVCMELGELRDGFDDRMFRRHVGAIVAKQQNASVDEVQVGGLVMDISRAAATSGMRMPSELTMLGKMLLNLDQVGRTLSPRFRPNDALRAYAAELMQERLRQTVSPAHVFEKALELNDLVERLPSRLNRFMDSVSRDGIKVDVIDEKVIIAGMQKVANRIAVGVILASLVLASALMMQVDTPWKIFGYPAVAIISFLAAAAGGAWLILDVMLKDDPVRKPRLGPRGRP